MSKVFSPKLCKSDINRFNDKKAFIEGDRIKLKLNDDKLTYTCAFLGEDHKCVCYENRPLECAMYPLLLSRDESGVYLASDEENCFFAAENKEVMKEYALQIKEYLEKELLLDEVSQLAEEYDNAVNLVKIG